MSSTDIGTFVLGMMTTNGSQNPSTAIKMTWGVLLSFTALTLLYSGGLQALQNTVILAAFPFSVIMILMIGSLLKSLNQEAKALGLSQFAFSLKKTVATKNKEDVKEVG